ncbi:MAG: RluA family pseudouridine synthase [Alphaproteobacteria bacterium]
MTAVQTIAVAEEDAEIRLDRWFRRYFPTLPHGRLEKLLRTGQVRVDGRRAKGATRLVTGQKVRVPPLGEAAETKPRREPIRSNERDFKQIRAMVIYRDDDVIAINKPPGLAVQGGSGVKRHVDAMLDGLRFDANDRPRLVHRLDKDTSGVLLLGRSASATARLAEAFRSRDAEKTYWALVAGVPKPRRGRISLDLDKRGGPGAERMVPADDGAGKQAVTYYTVLEAAGRSVSWLALRPLTGRTHQIRVHCAEIGTPVLGDGKYGGAEAFPAGAPDIRNLHLHARAIALPHPRKGRIEIVADLAPAMLKTWRLLGFDPQRSDDPFTELQNKKKLK